MEKETIMQAAEKVIRAGSVIITAADFADNLAQRLQVYFWDEHEAAMDIIEKGDLLQNWPDEGVFTLTPDGEDFLTPVGVFEGEEDYFIRIDDAETAADFLGELPSVVYMETVEAICSLKDPIKL